jgi:NAD(P)-dependent dehydrogenase (short-subunit alcohol dehydrogenase family)
LLQVKNAAKEFLSLNLELHGLLLNAGTFGGDHKLSAQGHEAAFAVNHLSHYLLASLLTEKLKSSATGKILSFRANCS